MIPAQRYVEKHTRPVCRWWCANEIAIDGQHPTDIVGEMSGITLDIVSKLALMATGSKKSILRNHHGKQMNPPPHHHRRLTLPTKTSTKSYLKTSKEFTPRTGLISWRMSQFSSYVEIELVLNIHGEGPSID